ncbi:MULTISPECIES: hypothetical protein [unclassified Mycobacterium]|uniref:hypothetical protein n=1 Tax=unclassified Mycobacterium TaxID=2642494 RepID=UPI0029C62FB1|nr:MULTISPECIES: hypothetical protein [unclassified Mycobacterium]
MKINRLRRSRLAVLPAAMLAVLGGISSQVTAAADPLPYGPDTCNQGFVWREAGPGDVVCVTPAVRSTAAQDNQQASQRVDPNGAYGPNSCKQGFVWREAYGGDVVCVTPATRSQAASDNAAAASRKAANAPAPAPAATPPACLGPNPAPGLIPAGVFCN